jgi:DNA-binding response OmpR family regulator
MTALTQANDNANATVLLVEGNILSRVVIAAYLRDCGYRVFEATNGGEAMTILSEPNLHVDVVLANLDLPGSMNGFALRDWISKARAGLKVVLTASPQGAAEAVGELCGGGPMLAKPYEPRLVEERIRRLLARGERQVG